MSNHKHIVEGDGFTAEVKVPEGSGVWTAKVRLEDDAGQRGKNLVLVGDSAQELADRLSGLASAFSQVQAKVTELAQPETPADPTLPSEQPQL